MVKKRATSGKRHYTLPVCNMTCLNLCYFFAVSFTPETPNFGTFSGVTFFFKFLLFNSVYAHILNLSYKIS